MLLGVIGRQRGVSVSRSRAFGNSYIFSRPIQPGRMANLAIFFGWMAELAELQFGLAKLTILPVKYSAKTQLNVIGRLESSHSLMLRCPRRLPPTYRPNKRTNGLVKILIWLNSMDELWLNWPQFGPQFIHAKLSGWTGGRIGTNSSTIHPLNSARSKISRTHWCVHWVGKWAGAFGGNEALTNETTRGDQSHLIVFLRSISSAKWSIQPGRIAIQPIQPFSQKNG